MRIVAPTGWLKILPLLLLAGCVFLPLESPRIPGAGSSAESSPEIHPPYREAVGVIHVHSRYSDGSGSVEEIARIAQAQGLDYVLLTDHNTLQARREEKGGWYGKVLLLADEEISTKGGHFLALRLLTEVEPFQEPGATIQAVRAAGGLGFVAHPFARRSFWRDRSVRGMTGLEVYSAREDMEDENPLALAAGMLLFGADLSTPGWLDRPGKALQWWDALLAEGHRVVGIGSTNAHGLRWLGFRFGPYATLFKRVRSHLLISGELTEEAVYDAMEQGHLFIAHDVVSDARGFFFGAVEKEMLSGVMGDEVRFSPGLRLYAYLPREGPMALFRDGRLVAQAQGRHGWFEVTGPGAYRLEATWKGRPWIYSNPIYVVE